MLVSAGALAAAFTLSGSQAFGSGTTPIACSMSVTTSIKAGNDLTNCVTGLIIGADGVTLDLNGHTIDGQSVNNGVDTNGHANVIVENGTITEFSDGIYVAPGSAKNTIVNITAKTNSGKAFDVHANGTQIKKSYAVACGINVVAGNVLLSKISVAGSPADGIFIDGNTNTVEGSVIAGSAGNGIDATGSGQTFTNNRITNTTGNDGIVVFSAAGTTVIDNVIGDSAGNGIDITGGSLKIAGNRIYHTYGNDGIALSSATGSAISDNTITDSAGNGIDITGANLKVTGNRVDDTTGNDGIALSSASGSKVSSNTVSGSRANGIDVTGGSLTVSGNQVTDSILNDAIVLSSATGSTVSGNTVLEAAQVGISATGSGLKIVSNTVAGTVNSGIYVGPGSGDTVEKNEVTGSASQDGIFASGGGSGHQLIGNVVRGNAHRGIRDSSILSTLTGNVAIANDIGIVTGGFDGGGNKAAGNVTTQCSGVSCSAP
jgi:parallel beta-helix repeat protein